MVVMVCWRESRGWLIDTWYPRSSVALVINVTPGRSASSPMIDARSWWFGKPRVSHAHNTAVRPTGARQSERHGEVDL